MAKPLVPRLTTVEACIFCQRRQLHRTLRAFHTTSQRLKTAAKETATTTPSSKQQPPKPQEKGDPIPTAHPASPRPGRLHIRARDGELVPQPLQRPLGLKHAPQPGQNTGIDNRTWRQRRDDLASYDKHLERRGELMKQLYVRNYFRDLGNIGRVHKGKSILAPMTPFRKEVALYFPNLRGRTLAGTTAGGDAGEADTTPVLRGRVSVVNVMNSQWAKIQCDTFVGVKENPVLHQLLKEEEVRKRAQIVEINVEENWLKWAMVRMFMGQRRKTIPTEQWRRYFLVRRGMTHEMRDEMGIWNSKVGHVFLLDGQCRIRWAGNGDAREDEKQSLVNCVRRLVDEARGAKTAKVTRQDPKLTGRVKPVEEEVGKQAVAASA